MARGFSAAMVIGDKVGNVFKGRRVDLQAEIESGERCALLAYVMFVERAGSKLRVPKGNGSDRCRRLRNKQNEGAPVFMRSTPRDSKAPALAIMQDSRQVLQSNVTGCGVAVSFPQPNIIPDNPILGQIFLTTSSYPSIAHPNRPPVRARHQQSSPPLDLEKSFHCDCQAA